MVRCDVMAVPDLTVLEQFPLTHGPLVAHSSTSS